MGLSFLSTHTKSLLLLQFLRRKEEEEGKEGERKRRGRRGKDGMKISLQLLTEALHHALTFRARSLSVVSTTETALA